MDKNTNKIETNPSIRFKGFTDAWVQRKLGEVAESFDYGLNAAATDFDGTNKYIRITDIDDDSRIFKTDSLTSPDCDLKMADNYILQNRDILFARTGASVGKTYLYRDIDGLVYFAGFLIRARIKSDFDVEFIFQNTLTINYLNFIKITSQRSGQPGVNAQEYESFLLFTPQIKEQHKLGNFFQNLDEIVDLYKRKVECLKKLKKAYLQQMFPQEGESVPKVRFERFDGDWKPAKIGEIFEVTRGQVLAATNVSPEKSEENIYPVYSSQTKNNGLLGYYNEFLFDTAITWTTDGANAGTVTFRKGKFYSTNVNGVLISKDGFANQCIAEILNLVAWKYVSKAGNPKLMNNVMSEIEITTPSIDEQTAISNFFRNLDEQITTQQNKMDNIKKIKSTYLKKMFV